MNLLSRCAEGITARFTDAAMKPRGGATLVLSRWTRPGHYGLKLIGNWRLAAKQSSRIGRVEDERGSDALSPLRFPSPLIKPDVQISRIRLSDQLHRTTHGGRPLRARIRCRTASSPNTSPKENREVPRLLTLCRLQRKFRTRS